jgi:23S rRNA pseudouridine2605 synthase
VEERLQKLMAQAGLGSRRACEVLISAGRVSVNGRIVGLGDKADPQRDRILVDGQPLKLPDAPVYIALYKPRGVLSAVSSPDPRPTVRDLVDLPGHLYPVGRLDVDSEGLILLTSDGELANRLTHPRYGHEKEYRVLVARRPDEVQLDTWRRGVVLEDGHRTAPAEIRLDGFFGKGAWLRVVLREGRKRQIRETGLQIGLPVVKIIRVRIGSLRLGVLKPREWRRLTDDEVAELKGKAVHKPKTFKAKPYTDAKKPWTKPASSKSSPPSQKTSVTKKPYPPSSAPKHGSGKSRQHKG